MRQSGWPSAGQRANHSQPFVPRDLLRALFKLRRYQSTSEPASAQKMALRATVEFVCRELKQPQALPYCRRSRLPLATNLQHRVRLGGLGSRTVRKRGNGFALRGLSELSPCGSLWIFLSGLTWESSLFNFGDRRRRTQIFRPNFCETYADFCVGSMPDFCAVDQG